MNPALLEILICPLCQGRLKHDAKANLLICHFDHIAYPIEENVPILLEERAIAYRLDEEKRN